MADISLPIGFGGLMRYKEEYNSKFKFSPIVVIVMIIITILFIIGLNIFL